jgi:hypothetical protein
VRRTQRRGDFDRLAAAIETFRAEVRARAAAVPGSWVHEANGLLDQARELDSDEAWTYYQAAVRHAVDGLTPAAVWNEQQILLAEAREKLSGWRRDAVTTLLIEPAGGTTSRKDELTVLAGAIGGDRTAGEAIAAALAGDLGSPSTVAAVERALRDAGRDGADRTAAALVTLFRLRVAEDRTALQAAMLVRDDDARNVHRRSRVFRRNVVALAIAAGALAAGLTVVALALPLHLGTQIADAPARVWIYGFLLGCLGAAVSALQRLTARGARGRVPHLREQALGTLVLPLAGAAAGTAAIPLASAGVIPVEHTIGATLAVAFVSGFSERLIVRAAEALPGSRSGVPAA